MPVKASIIIRCYNEEQHIGRLLSGIFQQNVQDIEVILVDSGSTDATVSIASRYPVKILTIRPEEFSFGRSLNIGCEVATGEFIVIVSAHVYPVYCDWLENLLTPFSIPQVGLVYGRQRGNEKTQYSEHQVFAQWFSSESNLNQDHPFCNNANAVIRRSLWEQFSYDEALTGLEDLDWAKRVMLNGYRIAYSAEAEIVHVHEETPQRIFNRYRREAIAFKRIFPQEHFNFLDFVRLVISNIVSDYYHAILDGLLWQNIASIPVFRLMQFWGTYRGFHQQKLMLKQLRQTFYYPRQISRSSDSGKDERARIDYSNLAKEVNLDTVH
jgi:rhamnosyltransferase